MRHLALFGLFIWLVFIASGTAVGQLAALSLQRSFPGSREVRVYAEEDVNGVGEYQIWCLSLSSHALVREYKVREGHEGEGREKGRLLRL